MNKDTQVLSTPEDAARYKERDIEATAWYKDEFGDHMKDKGTKAKTNTQHQSSYMI